MVVGQDIVSFFKGIGWVGKICGKQDICMVGHNIRGLTRIL